MAWDLLVVVVLILLNGFFALSELAVVSARKVRLQVLAEEGRRGAATALQLVENPGRFLSTIQIGITLVGILAGAYSGARFSAPLTSLLENITLLAPYSNELALGLVVVSVTYLMLVIGELLPKQLALRNAEALACRVAGPMAGLALISGPLVTVLDSSSKLGLRLIGKGPSPEPIVTDEEIKMLVAEATRAGVVKQTEQAMIEGVMRLADRPVEVIMTPRPDIHWLDINESPERIREILVESRHSRFPVGNGTIDEVLGVVQTKDLLEQCLGGAQLDLAASIHKPIVVYEGAGAMKLLDDFKKPAVHMALVIDEYGSLQGLATPSDILESIVGELAEQGTELEPEVVERPDGSWLVDGGLPVDELKELLQLRGLEVPGRFHTLAGLVLARLGRLPAVGDSFLLQNYRFEVVDMDGRRIDRVWIRPEIVSRTSEDRD